MGAYVIRRLLLAIPTVFLISLIVFFLIRLMPGEAVDALAAKMADQVEDDIAAQREVIMRCLGLDAPVPVQFARWLGVLPTADGSFRGLLQGDPGDSFWRPNTVVEQIALRWPVTLQLSLMGLLVAPHRWYAASRPPLDRHGSEPLFTWRRL